MHSPCVSDLAHFEEWYGRYWTPVVRFCATRLTGCPVGMAEDVTQEVFLIAYRALAEQRYRHEGALSTWLYGIAHHLCAKAQRAIYRQTTSPALRHLDQAIVRLEQAGEPQREASPSPAPAHTPRGCTNVALLRTWLERERKRLAQHIGEALHGAPPRPLDEPEPMQDAWTLLEESFHQLARQHRQAYSLLYMHVVWGTPVRELALAQGMSRSALHRRLAEAKTTLRRTYQARLQQAGY